MTSTRRIASPPPVDTEPAVPVDVPTHIAQAGSELAYLVSDVDACSACGRTSEPRVHSTGTVDADVLLVRNAGSPADVEAGRAFVDEAARLQLAFDALGVGFDRLRGVAAVRCGARDVTAEQAASCAPHLLTEIQIVQPRVVIAFGAALESVRMLDGWCGIRFPDDPVEPGEPVRIGVSTWLVATEPLPDALDSPDAKKRFWAHLQAVPELLK